MEPVKAEDLNDGDWVLSRSGSTGKHVYSVNEVIHVSADKMLFYRNLETGEAKQALLVGSVIRVPPLRVAHL